VYDVNKKGILIMQGDSQSVDEQMWLFEGEDIGGREWQIRHARANLCDLLEEIRVTTLRLKVLRRFEAASRKFLKTLGD
jgi:hypothetical protein